MTKAGWTSEKPTAAGWYWIRAPKHGWRDCVLWVDQDDDGFYIDVGDCDTEYVTDIDAEWLGPITPDSYRQGRVASCEWTYDDMDDYYETACKNAYCLADGTLKDNDHKYCPYCGGLIQLAQQAQEGK